VSGTSEFGKPIARCALSQRARTCRPSCNGSVDAADTLFHRPNAWAKADCRYPKFSRRFSHLSRTNVRYWPKADMRYCTAHVRFWE